jgi:hypothetical protein
MILWNSWCTASWNRSVLSTLPSLSGITPCCSDVRTLKQGCECVCGNEVSNPTRQVCQQKEFWVPFKPSGGGYHSPSQHMDCHITRNLKPEI